MQRYYPMMSSRQVPVPEDRRLLPAPVPSQPQSSVITPRGPAISQSTGIVAPTRPPGPVQRLSDIQTPMPRDSLVLPPMQQQDSGYARHATVPRRSSLDRDQRPVLPPGLSTSPGAHSTGQPSAPPSYTPVRTRRDSLSPPAPQSVQPARRDSISLAPQPSAQPLAWDPISATTPTRRDSIVLPPQPPPQSIHRSSVSITPQPPVPQRRATDPLPVANLPPPATVRRASESAPRGQGILVSTRVRFDDENLICPSPVPMHERRKGFHNRRGYAFPPPSAPSAP